MMWCAAGHVDDSVHSAPRVYLREAPVDVQAVRSERRRLHNEIGTRPNRVGNPRTDGQETTSMNSRCYILRVCVCVYIYTRVGLVFRRVFDTFGFYGHFSIPF